MEAQARPFLAYGLAGLGSLFWLAFLAAGIKWVIEYGLYLSSGALDEGVVLRLAVPLVMIVGTVMLGNRSATRKVPARVFLASSAIAAFALLLCLAVLGQGV